MPPTASSAKLRGPEAFITISQAARRAGLGVETVRFYEKEGLLDRPRRSAAGYRQYQAVDVRRLAFVCRAKELGFTLREIKELLALTQDRQATAGEVKVLASAKVERLRAQIRDLRRIERALHQLTTACSGVGPASDCPSSTPSSWKVLAGNHLGAHPGTRPAEPTLFPKPGQGSRTILAGTISRVSANALL